MSKAVVFVVNDVRELGLKQSTTYLIARVLERGRVVHLVESGTVYQDEHDRVMASGCWTVRGEELERCDVPALVAYLKGSPVDEEPVELTSTQAIELVLVRTNPARDARGWAHQNVLTFLEMVRDRGVRVVNDPTGLKRASTKFYLQEFAPLVRPRTMIARDAGALRGFIERMQGPCVLKPLRGTHGRDVFRVAGPGAENLTQILEIMTRSDYVIAQEFVPEAGAGDVRLLVVDGELFEREGKVGAVHRVPGVSDFRSNLGAGGTAKKAVITEKMREVVGHMGDVLRRDGIFFAGVDFIGSKVVEVNVFSPGGLTDAERFEGVDFTGALLDALL